jgi:hypothetical protein
VTPLATAADVETRLGRSLTEGETARVDPGLLEEASIKVLSHLKVSEDYYDEITIPATVVIVTSRMVARVIEQAANIIVTGADQITQSAGIFAQTATFTPGSTSGSPWLTKQDRADLDNVLGANKSFAIDTAPGACTAHDMACSIYFGGACSCGADIAGCAIYGVE